MLTIRSRWRVLALMLPVALVIAAVAVFMGGSTNTQDPAFAVHVSDNSGVTCADVFLGNLNRELSEPLPAAIGDVTPGSFLVATSVTTTFHNATENQYFTGPVDAVRGVGVVINLGIPNIIAGAGNGIPLCASIDKVVATVSSVSAEPSGAAPDTMATVAISPTFENEPLIGMVVYWDSNEAGNPSRLGYWVVTSTDGTSTATLHKTFATLCNGTPDGVAGNGSLHACTPENKGFPNPVFANVNSNTVVGGVLDPSTAPRAYSPDACATCTNVFLPDDDCTGGSGEGCTVSVSCSPASGAPEDPEDPVGQWTRTEIRTTSYGGDTSDKTPSYGVTLFYSPVDPKTCDANANTLRSVTYNVVWALDGVSINHAVGSSADPAADGWDSDSDKDGCLDWEEQQAPQPVSVADGSGGRDAFNPYDCGENGRTVDGVWSITVAAEAISTSDAGNTVDSGSFFRCRASIVLPDVRIYCYRDDPTVDINFEDAPGVKGDGYAGSIWPTGFVGSPPAALGPYGDTNATHDVLTGVYSAGSDTLSLSGCLVDEDGANPEGHVYWRTSSGTDISLLSGYGEIDVWLNQTEGNCTGDSPSGSPDYDDAGIFVGIQGDFSIGYDQDLDGNPNSRELNDDSGCGLRDPFNRYDYYDVSVPKDGVIDLANDILGVILHFAPGGTPAGDERFDRPPKITGGAHWNRDNPDGVIDLANDILGVILQFNPGGCGL